MAQPDDSARSTVECVLDHDGEALEALLLERYDWLRDLVLRGVPAADRGRTSVDEVLREVFVQALRGFPSFKPAGEASLFAWLETIVQRTVQDARRKTSGTNQASIIDAKTEKNSDSVSEFISSLSVSTDPRAGVAADSQELTQAFHVALANLDPQDKQVIEILYFEQLSFEQAAQRLGTTPAEVRNLQQRAREKIREAMVRLSYFV